LKLILHLKMTGCLLIRPSDAEPLPHTRAILYLDNSTSLHFLDQRKFGGMWLVQNENEVVGGLGPEPLDHAFSVDALRELLSQHDIPVKPLLCDQMIIAGIGNMYADEALFEARIHPEKKTRKLKAKECERLYNAICHVLVEGIARCGASVSTYQQPDGEPGFAHLFFQVAHRRGERCYRCETPIKRIALRGRGTYFCPKCQKR
jgi:formamidopyrimidine-DNA glycosylase